MKVLIFSLSYHPLIGGAEVAIKEITDRISPDEIKFEMVTMRFDKSHPRVERIGNVDVYRIGGGLGYLSKIFFALQAALFVLRRKYDLHWAMMTYMLFPISMAHMLGKGMPYVLTLQDGDPFEHVFSRNRISIFKPLLSYGFKNARKVQAISHFLAHWAKKLGYEGKVEVIPNGVDVKKFEAGDSKSHGVETTSLITTSRLVEKNAVRDIIKALTFLPERVKLKIAGTGPLEPELRQQTEVLGLKERVEFLGSVPQHEIPRYLHEADIFIRPSLSEGFGVSFIEAMAAGVPVIATPVGGIVDFLKDGETGVFCRPNDPKSICEAVNRLLSDPVLVETIKANALEMVKEKYDWDLIAEEMRSRVFNL